MKNYNQRANILFQPLVTEKTTNQAAFGKYSFKVATYANKIEVKKMTAIASLISIRA